MHEPFRLLAVIAFNDSLDPFLGELQYGGCGVGRIIFTL